MGMWGIQKEQGECSLGAEFLGTMCRNGESGVEYRDGARVRWGFSVLMGRGKW